MTELQPPDNADEIARTFKGYRMALAEMKTPQLLAELTRLNALLELEQRQTMTRVVSAPLSDYISKLDQAVLRSDSMLRRSPSPRDRGVPPSRSPQPSPLDLLFGSRGRRMAAKLVAANARSINGKARR